MQSWRDQHFKITNTEVILGAKSPMRITFLSNQSFLLKTYFISFLFLVIVICKRLILQGLVQIEVLEKCLYVIYDQNAN